MKTLDMAPKETTKSDCRASWKETSESNQECLSGRQRRKREMANETVVPGLETSGREQSGGHH